MFMPNSFFGLRTQIALPATDSLKPSPLMNQELREFYQYRDRLHVIAFCDLKVR